MIKLILSEEQAGFIVRLIEADKRKNLPEAEEAFLDSLLKICDYRVSLGTIGER